jgi:replicative DNA helicase
MTVRDRSADAAERCLVGALIHDRDAIASVADRITADAFANPRFRAIYAAAVRCWEKRVPPDVLTVHLELANDPAYTDERTWMEAVVDIKEAMEFVVAHGWITSAPYYADEVVGLARKRAMEDAGAELVKLAHRGGDVDPGDAIHEALSGLDRFGAATGPVGPRAYDDIIPEYQERVMRIRSGEIPNRVMRTAFGDLDRKLAGGFYPGELVILAARPSMGKTALALQLAHNVARDRKRVLVFSAEMSRESLLKRAVAGLAGPRPDRSEYEFTDREFNTFLETLDRLRDLPLSIDDTPGITTAQMTVRVQNAQRRGDVGLVVFDYIELAGDVTEGDSEERRINTIVKALKRIARVCDVPVLALCQLNRGTELRENKRPKLADLRYSGSIEQDADKVLLLYRADYYASQGTGKTTVDPGSEGIAEVIVAKHRNGPTGTVKLRFEPASMRFFGIDHLMAPPAPWEA